MEALRTGGRGEQSVAGLGDRDPKVVDRIDGGLGTSDHVGGDGSQDGHRPRIGGSGDLDGGVDHVIGHSDILTFAWS